MNIWGQKSTFCMVIAIFVNKAYHQHIRGYNFPPRTTPQKNSEPMLWVIFRGSPLFLAVSGHSFWKRQLFSLNNFFRLWPEHGQNYEMIVFWPKISVFGQKNPIFAVQTQFWSMAHLEPSERLFISHVGSNFSTFRSRVMAVQKNG